MIMPTLWFIYCKECVLSAAHLILTRSSFSAEIEVTVDFLVEIDKLVQLIESPIFTCKCQTQTCYQVERCVDRLF